MITLSEITEGKGTIATSFSNYNYNYSTYSSYQSETDTPNNDSTVAISRLYNISTTITPSSMSGYNEDTIDSFTVSNNV
jgi:hypothetical protein